MKTPRKCRTLGLLDLYGFESESCESGGFEQLVFNFASEKVQNVINDWTVIMEQQEYLHEGVEWCQFENLTDNIQVVTLLERGSLGVFSILDEVCMSSHNLLLQPPLSISNSNNEDESGTSTPSLMTVSPDDIFVEKLSERFNNHPCLEVRPPGGYSGNTTAPVSSDNTAGEGSTTPEVSTETNKLPHHCFR